MSDHILSKLLSDRIKELAISDREAARLIGVSSTTISRVKGGDPADVETLIKICEWLGVSPSHVLDAQLPGTGALGAQIAAVLERNPQLAVVFGEAMDRILRGDLDLKVLEDITHYAAYRMNMSVENTNAQERAT